jgi:hypothetical protein
MTLQRVPSTTIGCSVPGCDWALTVLGYPPLSTVYPILVEHFADHGITEDDARTWLGLTAGL